MNGDKPEPQTQEPELISRARRTQTERLRRRLSGDLDKIALEALRKEPERLGRSRGAQDGSFAPR